MHVQAYQSSGLSNNICLQGSQPESQAQNIKQLPDNNMEIIMCNPKNIALNLTESTDMMLLNRYGNRL